MPEAEQAGSRPGAGSGQLESLEWAGVSVLQRRRGGEGTALPSLQAPGRVAGLGWCGGRGGPAGHQVLPLSNKVPQAGEK